MPERQIIGPLLLALLCLVALMQCAPPAKAQSAATASADAALPLTPGSACGAQATGRRIDGRITTEQAPGWHVDRDGGWTTCRMPREPSGCLVPRGYSWVANGAACRSPSGGQALPHGGISQALQAVGSTAGLVVLQCVDGALFIRLATCSPVRVCDGLHAVSDDGGKTTWRWAGSIAVGARDVATSDDGDTRPVECLPNGTMKLL